MVVKYKDGREKERLKGGKHLKASQAYPSMLLGKPRVLEIGSLKLPVQAQKATLEGARSSVSVACR